MQERIRGGIAVLRAGYHKLSSPLAKRRPPACSTVKRLLHAGKNGITPRLPGNEFFRQSLLPSPLRSRSSGIAPLRGRLEATSRSLSQCVADKEPVFLEIGDKLRDFSSRSRELSKSAEALTGIASGEEMHQAMRELQSSQQELRSLWDEEDELNRRLWNALRDLVQDTRGLRADMEGFGPRIKQLHMLSLYTRIESARMGGQGGGFLNLAGQVEDLAQTTESHVADIDKRTGQTLEIVQGAMDRMKSSGSERTERMLQKVEEACSDFGAMQERASQMASGLDERTSAIASAVQEVVSSVQFHDITRQQVEHVTEVLSEVASMLAENASGREEVLGWLVDVCQLQERQLDSTQQEFSRAMQGIRDNLGHIAEKIRSLETDIVSLSGESGDEETSPLQLIRERVGDLMEPMRRALESWNKVRGDMDTTAGEVQGMESCVDQVEAISGEIKLIALNASIQAAHTGERGRSMGVMAEEVRTLSSEVGNLTQRVGDRLKRIVQHSDGLRSEAERASELSQRQEDLVGGLEAQVRTLQKKDADMSTLLDWLSRESADLASDIERTDSGADLEDQVRAELSSAQETLAGVREESRQLTSGAETDSTSRSERLQEILQRYTMESERMVHMAFAGLEPEQAEAAEAGEKAEETETAQDEEDLGDNVELF